MPQVPNNCRAPTGSLCAHTSGGATWGRADCYVELLLQPQGPAANVPSECLRPDKPALPAAPVGLLKEAVAIATSTDAKVGHGRRNAARGGNGRGGDGRGGPWEGGWRRHGQPPVDAARATAECKAVHMT